MFKIQRRKRKASIATASMSDIGFLLLIFIMLISLINQRHEEKIEYSEAKILEKIKNSYIRFKWKDDDDESSYTEIRMVRNDVTNDYILVITDFTDDDDHEQLEAIWSDNLVRLHHSSGL